MTRKLTLRASAAVVTLGLGASVAPGCLDRPIDRLEPKTTSTVVERLTQSGVDKIDLLLAIDNSGSMGDKQQILAAAVPDLVQRLVTPNCVECVDDDMDPGTPDVCTPTGTVVDAAGECAAPGEPEFAPIVDINVGVISSSLGALSAAQCDGLPGANPTQNDKGRLLSRAAGGGTVATYNNNLGFLAWDPTAKRVPPGSADAAAFISDLTDMVVGVDQVGCGYEMQLESIVRFLVDPAPYDTIANDGSGNLIKTGVDQVVLQQRKDFVRSNSLLAVIILSDENDCSVDHTQTGYYSVLNSQTFYKATDECATDPNDPCCTSCAFPNPSGCAADTACGSQGTVNAARYNSAAPDLEDATNIRCFDQKRRYGVNLLFPIARYINAFTLPTIDPTSRTFAGDGEQVQNPIFTDLSGEGKPVRDKGLVFVAGIVGVPWQAIARKNTAGAPDLTLGFKTYNELAQDDAFVQLIGDPDGNIPPTDPFMIESIAKRSGTSVLTGETLPGANPINGNDHEIPLFEDLQYACIFPLNTADPAPNVDCSVCVDASCDDPLCDLAGTSTTQINAKAYPGTRELALLEGMGDQGIFASICPAEVVDTTAPEYGYRPAVGAIVDRLKLAFGGQCLPRKLTPDVEGNVPCLVLEATATQGSCNCEANPGHASIPTDDAKYNAVKAAQEDEFADPNWDCFCEIVQLTGADRDTCQTQAAPTGVDGWCYIDATTVPPTGDPALVAQCPEGEKRLVQFVGAGEPQSGATVFITCTGE